MADVQQRVTDLENEVKVLKNEIKPVLFDIREHYLNAENPFALAEQVVPMNRPSTDSTTPSSPSVSDDSAMAAPHNGPVPNTNEASSSTTDIEPNDSDKEAISQNMSVEPDIEEESYTERESSTARAYNKGNASQKDNKKALECRSDSDKGSGNGINLITIAGLSKWVDESTEKLGKERAEVMIEACHMIGHVSSELKDLLIKLVYLAQTDEPKKGKTTTKDYLGVIAKLDNILGCSSKSEAALLSILTDGKGSDNG